VSLALFVIALRYLGSARTSAHFSTAPFFGATVAVLALGEPITLPLVVAGALMGLGVWLHVSERQWRHHHLMNTHTAPTRIPARHEEASSRSGNAGLRYSRSASIKGNWCLENE
jgi:hypothetical protein